MNKTIQALLITLVILLGIFIGFQYEKKSSIKPIMNVEQEILKFKQLHTPQYLSEQIINHKAEYIENRPVPTNEEEKIIAYYEDFHFNKYDKNPEVYEENGTVYTNLNGQVKAIASQDKDESTPMMPKLSASKEFISYTWCNEKTNSCDVIVKNLITDKEVILNDAESVAWHPKMDVLLYAVSKSDNGHNFTQSEVYMYDVHQNSIIQLTDSSEFIETNPIFSKDGNSIYCADDKTNRLVYFKLWGDQRDKHISAIKFYKTANNSLGIEEIKKRSNLFMPIDKDERFCEKNMTYWIEFELDKATKSGQYHTLTYPFLFNQNSFTQKQLTLKNPTEGIVYTADKNYNFNFSYEAGVDATHYYFHLESYVFKSPFSQGLFKIEKRKKQSYEPIYPQRYTFGKSQLIYKLLSAIVIGMILMSALYTAIIFVYRRQKEFIYYTLMQVSMSLLLLTNFRGIFFSNNYVGDFSLLVALFGTLFTQAFLRTKKHFPNLHIILNFYLVLIIADMIWIFWFTFSCHSIHESERWI